VTRDYVVVVGALGARARPVLLTRLTAHPVQDFAMLTNLSLVSAPLFIVLLTVTTVLYTKRQHLWAGLIFGPNALK